MDMERVIYGIYANDHIHHITDIILVYRYGIAAIDNHSIGAFGS